MINNAQVAASTSPGVNHGSIDPSARRAYLVGGGIALRFMKRSFHLSAPRDCARRHPKVADMQEVVANCRGLRTGALIALVFGVIILDGCRFGRPMCG